MSRSSSTQRKVGTLLSYALLLGNTVINLAYVPILLSFIGVAEFGLYRLLGSVIAYFNVLDFGLSATITRFLVKYKTLKDQVKIDKLLTMSLLLYVGIGVILSLCGLIVYYCIPYIFKDSLAPEMIDSAKKIFLLLLLNLLMLFASKVFDAVIISEERFIFHRLISLIQILLQPFAIVGVLIFYPTALSVVLVQTVFNLLLVLVKVIYCRRVLQVRFVYHGWDSEILLAMRNLSLSLFVVSVVDQVFWQSNQLLIGIKIGAESVAIYAIASQIYINYMNISLAVSSTLLPKITAMVTNRCSDEEFQHLFLKVGRLQFYLLSLILSGFILFGHSFLHYWVGDGFDLVYWITLIIIVPFTIDLIQNVGLSIMQARNVYHVRAVIYVFVGILNVVLAYYWIDMYGIAGGAVATGLSMLLGNGIIMNVYYHRYMNLNIVHFWKQIARLSVVMILLTVLGLYVIPHIDLNSSIYIFVISMLLYSFIYFGVQWISNFNSYEKNLFYSFFLKVVLIKKSC